jgi:hypothetical protein
MAMTVGWVFALVVLVVLFYPAILFVDHMLFPHLMEGRMREYRVIAAKLIMNEYMSVQIINKKREQMGLPLIPYNTVLEGLDQGFGPWATLRMKANAMIQDALRHVSWLRIKQ